MFYFFFFFLPNAPETRDGQGSGAMSQERFKIDVPLPGRAYQALASTQASEGFPGKAIASGSQSCFT